MEKKTGNGQLENKGLTAGNQNDYKLNRFSSVPDEDIDWLWYPYIPFGMVTMIQGYPGSGKSSMLLDIIARASCGGMMPDGSRLKSPIATIYQCTESGSQSVTRKMLCNSGADLDAVSYIEGSSLTISDERIRRAVTESGSKILVIDPIQNFFEMDMSSAMNVRKQFAEISRFAVRTGCAVIMVGHFTKKGSAEAQYQGMGSADIAALARSILHVRIASEGSSLRFVRQVKCNVAPPGVDYGFELTDLGKVNWIGPIERDEVEELDREAGRSRTSKLNEAMEEMSLLLYEHDVSAIDTITHMREKGFSMATIRRAKRELEVQSVRQSDMSWAWHLPQL